MFWTRGDNGTFTRIYATRKVRRVCGDCSHHQSIHAYDPADGGRMPPAKCAVPGCLCARFRPAEPFERLKHNMETKP